MSFALAPAQIVPMIEPTPMIDTIGPAVVRVDTRAKERKGGQKQGGTGSGVVISPDGYVVTNNHFQGKAVANALQLIHLLRGNPVAVPETLIAHYPELADIAMPPSAAPVIWHLTVK
mgnify:CR=1 FL=1